MATGTLLDNSILLWGSGMSDSNVHNHDPLPILLAGGGAGRLQGGRHIRAGEGKKVPLANLHVALLRKAGVEVDSARGQHRNRGHLTCRDLRAKGRC